MATQTNNYNLTLREANDYFNPMLPTNENMEKIDEQMKANDDHAVTTATELVTGTVHALTRLNTDCAVFRFTATSNYEAGHTFTVDGVQVTALLTNGTTIPTGAYIIGSEVLCVLKGTLLTIMASGASLALDSNKLDGHTADYYAKNSELTDVRELATQNGKKITTLNNSLVKVKVIEFIPNSNGTMWINSSILGTEFDKLCACVNMSNVGYVIMTPFWSEASGWGIKSLNFQSGSAVVDTNSSNVAIFYI